MNTYTKPIRILLVDDHKSFSDGLAMLINTNKSVMEVVGMANNTKEAIAAAAQTKPDIILLDVDLGDENGIEFLPELNNKTDAKVIILTGAQNPTLHENAIMQGARGVLLKSDPAKVILTAIERVYNGEMWLNNATLNKVLSRLTQTGSNGRKHADPEEEKIATLTARERGIIKALVKNDSSTNQEVADRLYISASTLKNHLTTIYSKLGIKNRIELFK
ncbi:MAG: response regulator transcription factor, partial [Acidobacteria bacterium]|nr:response regulator transcription factor [Acidobacteriota bacterium]